MSGGIRLLVFLILAAMLPAGVSAQQFSTETSQFIGENAKDFLRPLTDAIVADLHSGFVTLPDEPGFRVGVRLVAMGVIVPDDQKVFTPKPFSKTVEFTYNGLPFLGDLELNPQELPTAAGLGRKYTFTGRLKRIRPKGSPYLGQFDFIQQDATVSIGGYQDLTFIPMFVPQVDVGSYEGTAVTLRLLPSVTFPDVGELSVFGVGIRHDIGRYFQSPVGVAVQLSYQTANVNAKDRDFALDLSVSGFSAQVFASKSFLLDPLSLSPYVGAGYESGSVDIRYAFADPYIGAQSLNSKSSGLRCVAGLLLKFSRFTLNADAHIASMNGFSAGLGVEF